MKSTNPKERSQKERVDSMRLKKAENNETDLSGSPVITDKTTIKAVFSPDALVRAAISAHPSFKFAMAVAGLAALVAIVQSWGVSHATLIFGAIVMVALMVLFLVFSVATKTERKLRRPALLLVWSITLIVIAVLILLFMSAFFDVPLRLRDSLEHATSHSETKKENPQKTSEESPKLVELAEKINDERSELQKKLDDLKSAGDNLVRGLDKLRIISIVNSTTNLETREISEKLERLINDYDRLSNHRSPEVQRAHELATSAAVGLNWNPSKDLSVIGYNVWTGEQPDSRTVVANAGTNLSMTIPNLKPGKTYYFSVTAYNADGEESDSSEEINYTVPLQTKED